MSGRYTTSYREELRRLQTWPQRVVAAALVVLAIAVPFILQLDIRPPLGFPWSSWQTNINLALVAAIGAAAFNLLLGYTHQISVAHAAFLMLGSMTASFFGIEMGWPFPIVLAASLVTGAVIGVIVALPALRFRGLYLLVATFGVHFIFLFLYQRYLVRYYGFSSMRFPAPTLPTWIPGVSADDNGQFEVFGNFRWYWILLVVAVGSIWFMSNVVRTREGRAFRAIAQHDVSASLIGINVTRSKMLAFAVSSAFVSLAGALGSYFIGARGEDSFPFSVVLGFAIMIIVGGFSTMTGAVMGAFFFYLVPLLFAWGAEELPVFRDIGFLQRYQSETHLAIFGILIIVVLLVRPTGLAGVWGSVKGYFARWPYST